MTYYVYPKVFAWDQIIPTDYPFIHMKGPEGTKGVLLVFDDLKKYEAFCEGDYIDPLKIEEVDRGKKQD